MQLVPRTWSEAGWMYSSEQLLAAIAVADSLRWGGTSRLRVRGKLVQ